eukprot:5691514-Prymnesium_polylepis.1
MCIGPGFNTFGLQDYGLGVAVAVRTGNATLYFSPVWRQFELSSPQHNVFVLAQPFNGRKLLIDPPTMGMRFLEDVGEWLNGPRVDEALAWRYAPKGVPATGTLEKIASKLEKMSRGFAVCGGPKGYLLLSFTVEFARDKDAVRRKLNALRGDVLAHPSKYPAHDFDCTKLHLPEPCTMAAVEGAMAQSLGLMQHQFALEGTPFLIATEPSGDGSISTWVEGERNVHGTLVWIGDPALFADHARRTIIGEVRLFCDKVGLAAKQCGDEDVSMPGFKPNLNYPATSVLLW